MTLAAHMRAGTLVMAPDGDILAPAGRDAPYTGMEWTMPGQVAALPAHAKQDTPFPFGSFLA